jgi:glycosyltransferase involved in cell wall biosynthesis
MKKVLIFSTAYFPFVGGAEIAVKEITDRLAGEYEFDLIAARFKRALPRVEVIGSVTVYRIGFGIPLLDKLWLPWGGALKSIRLNRANGYTAFWCMMATYGSGAAYIANFFLHTRVPIILTLQEGDSERYLRRKWFGLVNFSWRLALRHAKELTVISTYLGARARRLGYQGPLELIPNGVDIAHFTKAFSREAIDAMKEKLGKKEGDVFLVTTSRLVHKNAVDDVIRTLQFLPPNVQFLIYGIGPDEAMLRSVAKERGVTSRVRFMGHIKHADMPVVLRACDIFIRPSRSEGMGNSFVEAMAAGMPVIATQEGGIADFLFDARRNPDAETTGWAVDTDAPEQIAAAVTDILAHPERVAAVTETAQTMVIKKYDWDIIARAMKAVFDRMLAEA